MAVLVAAGVDADGHREILCVQVNIAETRAGWWAFFRDLVARGLSRSPWSPPMPTPATSRRSRHAAWGQLAEVSHPLRGQLDVGHAEELVALGDCVAARGLRPGRRAFGA